MRSRARRLVIGLAPTAMASVSAVPRIQQRLERTTAIVRRLEISQRRLAERAEALTRTEEELAATRKRLAELQAEVQETRRLHQRVAELTDVVAEVLLPAADRDDERLRAALERFSSTSF
jgi:DNA repair exonuclease SbcCD ATPase subunit